MSMILMAQAMKLKVGNPLRKLVLIKLADNANDEGLCWPSHSHIANHCEMSKRSVINHITYLEENGYLTVINRVKDNKKQVNQYQLHFEKIKKSSESPALSSSESAALPSESPALPSSESPAHRTYHSSEPINEDIKGPVQDIFEFWKETMGKKRSKLTKKLESKIKARLDDDFTIDDLKAAITGCALSDYHMGKNDSGSRYDSLELIFRNANKTEEFIEKNKNYLRKKSYEADNTRMPSKSLGGITAADIFAMGEPANDSEGAEISSASIREINPRLR